MDNTGGWVKLWRKSFNNPLYMNGKPFDEFHAWIDLIMLADSAGTFKTSLKWLQTRWNWSSVKVVRAYLGKLKGTNMITVEGTLGRHGGITIKLCKYWGYQHDATLKKSEKGHIKKRHEGHIKGQTEDTSIKEDRLSKASLSAALEPKEDKWSDINAEEFDE